MLCSRLGDCQLHAHCCVYGVCILSTRCSLCAGGPLRSFQRRVRSSSRLPVLLVFCLGSALSGASTSIWFLIVSRGIQGIGGGGLLSLGLVIVGDIVEPAQRSASSLFALPSALLLFIAVSPALARCSPKYVSGLSSIFGLASIVAPLVGGVLTDKV